MPAKKPGQDRLDVDVSELARLYFEEKLPLKRVADAVGVGRETVRGRLKDAGYDLRPVNNVPKPADVAEIVRLYVDERLTCREIGRRVGLSDSAVRVRLLDAGIQLRSPGDYPHGGVPLVDLERLYFEEGLTLQEVGAEMCIHPTTVGERLRNAGHELRTAGPATPPVETSELVRLYVEQKMSFASIGQTIGLSPATVAARLQQAGVAIRSRGPAKPDLVHKARLVDLYVHKRLSIQEIADETGIGYGTVKRLLRLAGVQLRGPGPTPRISESSA